MSNRRSTLTTFARRVACVAAAGFFISASHAVFAADMARQSALGEVFADRPARVVINGRGETKQQPVDDFPLTLAPRTPGYYGREGDYAYRSYYGTSPMTIFTRQPYACGFLGLC